MLKNMFAFRVDPQRLKLVPPINAHHCRLLHRFVKILFQGLLQIGSLDLLNTLLMQFQPFLLWHLLGWLASNTFGWHLYLLVYNKSWTWMAHKCPSQRVLGACVLPPSGLSVGALCMLLFPMFGYDWPGSVSRNFQDVTCHIKFPGFGLVASATCVASCMILVSSCLCSCWFMLQCGTGCCDV